MEKQNKTAQFSLTELTSVATVTVKKGARLALKEGDSDEIHRALAACDTWTKGWFAEGLACGLYVRGLRAGDGFPDLRAFLASVSGVKVRWASFVGVGIAAAEAGVFSEELMRDLAPLDAMWVLDGVGSIVGMMMESPAPEAFAYPEHIQKSDARFEAFAAGFGRGLWFRLGEANVSEIADLIAALEPETQESIWRGVAFAASYAGGSEAALRALVQKAGEHADFLKIGCALALAGKGEGDVPHRDLAARVLVGRPGKELCAAAERVMALFPQTETSAGERVWFSFLESMMKEVQTAPA